MRRGDWLSTGSYTDNGTSGRDIAVPFQPIWVGVFGAYGLGVHVVYHNGIVGQPRVLQNQNQDGTESIQALLTTGFRVGNGSHVNATGTGYHWIAFGSAVDNSQRAKVYRYIGDGTADRRVSITALDTILPIFCLQYAEEPFPPLRRSAGRIDSMPDNQSQNVSAGVGPQADRLQRFNTGYVDMSNESAGGANDDNQNANTVPYNGLAVGDDVPNVPDLVKCALLVGQSCYRLRLHTISS